MIKSLELHQVVYNRECYPLEFIDKNNPLT